MRKKSQIATILTLIIALIFLFAVITINMGKVSQKKTVIDNACDGAGLLLASGLSSVANALRTELGLFDTKFGSKTEDCSRDWKLIIGAIIAVIGVVSAALGFTFGATPFIMAAAAAFFASAGLVGASAFEMINEPGMLKEMEAKYQNMTAEQRLFEGAVDYAIFATIDDLAYVPDRFDVDRDNRRYPEKLDKIPRFSHWYFQRLNSLPRVGQLVQNFYHYLFSAPSYFDIERVSGTWIATATHLIVGAGSARWRVRDWLKDEFKPFMHELWCYGYGVNFAKESKAGPCATTPGPGPGPGPGGFIWPAGGPALVTTYFHESDCRYWSGPGCYHKGIDIGVGCGSSVLAAAAGTVISVGLIGDGTWGQAIMIDHGGGLVSIYAHLSSISVSAGRTVTQGQFIGLSGNTGLSTGCHLHFEIQLHGTPVDPMGYLGSGTPTPTPAPTPGPEPVPTPPPTLSNIEDDRDELGELYRDIKDFETFIKNDVCNASKEELVGGFEEWFSQFYTEDKDAEDWYDRIGNWITTVKGWIKDLNTRHDQVVRCINKCRSRASACRGTSLCESLGRDSPCDWDRECHRDADGVRHCHREAVKWRACCGDWKECCELCGTECAPTATCDTPTTPLVGSNNCCDTGCRLKLSCTATRIQDYIDKLSQFILRMQVLRIRILEVYDEAKKIKNNFWFRRAMYIWQDKVLNDSGSGVPAENPVHAVYVEIEVTSDFKFPYITQKNKDLGFTKCKLVQNARGEFYVRVGRYDEDMAKQGPLKNFWRFKFRSNPGEAEKESGASGGFSDVNTLRTIATRYAAKLNDGNSCKLDELMSVGEYYSLSNFIYNNGIVADIVVGYGPGTLQDPKEGQAPAAFRNVEVRIKKRIK